MKIISPACIAISSKDSGHSVISPKILGRNWDFPKGSVWEGKSLFKVPGRKGFREEFEFLPVRKFDVDDLQRL